MIAYGSGNSDGNRHTHENLPILLAGKGGGTLKTGRHVRYPQETPVNNLWLAMLDRMGAPTETPRRQHRGLTGSFVTTSRAIELAIVAGFLVGSTAFAQRQMECSAGAWSRPDRTTARCSWRGGCSAPTPTTSPSTSTARRPVRRP